MQIELSARFYLIWAHLFDCEIISLVTDLVVAIPSGLIQ